MGILDSIGNALFGGLGASTNPNDYQVNNPQQQAINNLMRQQSAQLNPQQQAQFRQMQLAQAQRLQQIASGQQQGAGELAAQRQVQNALAAQQAQARMARGANSALAMRNAADNSAAVGLSGAGQAQRAALQDQQAAQAQLAGTLAQGRGQDLSLAGQNAQLANERYGQNLGALTGLNAQQLGAQQNAMSTAVNQQGILGGLINAGGTALGAYLGGLGGSGGGGNGFSYAEMPSGFAASPAQGTVLDPNSYIFSDANLKTDIADAGTDIDSMLDNLHAKTYRYKDPKHGEGERTGVMAQDLMKSKAGSAVVTPTPDGLALDPGKAISAALAATARLHERMTKLEGKRA